jgi:hypothetical protein
VKRILIQEVLQVMAVLMEDRTGDLRFYFIEGNIPCARVHTQEIRRMLMSPLYSLIHRCYFKILGVPAI